MRSTILDAAVKLCMAALQFKLPFKVSWRKKYHRYNQCEISNDGLCVVVLIFHAESVMLCPEKQTKRNWIKFEYADPSFPENLKIEINNLLSNGC